MSTIASRRLAQTSSKVALAALLILTGVASRAATLDSAAFGTYLSEVGGGSTIIHGAPGYFAGEISDFFGANAEVRSYIVFDLSSINAPITAATLRLYNPAGGFQSPAPIEILALSAVTTNIASLMAGSGGLAAFSDLGSGTVLAIKFVSAADNSSFVDISLNAAASLAYLNAGIGNSIAIGGSMYDLDNSIAEDRHVFAFSGAPLSNAQLVVQVVPLPAATWLFGSALGVLVRIRRKVGDDCA